MLDYLILGYLSGKLAEMLNAKGRSPGGYQVLLFVLSIGCAIAGGLLGVVFGLVLLDGDELAYVFAIIGVLLGMSFGAGAVFLLASLLPPLDGVHLPDGADTFGPGWRHSDRDRLRRYEGEGPRPARDGDGFTDRADDVPRRRPDDRLME